ncbi:MULTISPECIES: DUF3085 domain-containing protein [Pectobacteriaceae]|nr:MULTISPECIES: DUF3085 domain-containing protein [Pectobacteriaceae]MEE3644414.1 DUF3085 domain-containing protein [Brenneria sp. L3_3C_1]MEE3651976.1 DUF3085 domain-containing protein [Brenneria sp. HEZEL_4_2_4]MEE3663678.1 DUF3085 domain-containing protein [Brenneria sp. g21c3]MBJ7223171.1 DUF3085 domain-containing protein [Brenneria sp. L3-3C-1]MDX5628616.1 DUF3085 domain-containing protein [Brenneria sp. L3-3Z]
MKRSVIFKSETLSPVIQEARKNKCRIILVKDHGLYMMAEKGERDTGTGRQKTLCYAEGFNPDIQEFDQWYDELNAICGGDDFGEFIDINSSVFSAVTDNRSHLVVTFTDTQFELKARKK